MDNILLNAQNNFPRKDLPEPGYWKLEDSQHKLVSLDKWNSYDADKMMYTVLPTLLPGHPVSDFPHLSQAFLGSGSWRRISDLRSFQLSPYQCLEVRGQSHLLIVIHCRGKVRLPNKKKRIEESRHEFLIATQTSISDLVAGLQTTNGTGTLFIVPETSNGLKLTDNRIVAELGWAHGTELRLEMW